MIPKGFSFLIFLLAIAVGYSSKEFRFDYEFSEEAGGWLKFHEVPAIWTEAKMRCNAEGAVLASPLTNQLKTAVVEFVKHKQSPKYNEEALIFTGVHATFSKGLYSSLEGVPLHQLAITWAQGEPDNHNNSEDCLVMSLDSNGTMADESCDDVLPYVCFKEYSNLTMTECGTTDPEYVLERTTGSCYKFHSYGLVWWEAYMTCQAEGGYLAIINSREEANMILSFRSRYPSDPQVSQNSYYIALGFHDMGVHHNFMTIHGETLNEAGYDTWGPGQPNNGTNYRTGEQGEFCGCISTLYNGELHDCLCNSPTSFLCEMSPNSLRHASSSIISSIPTTIATA